MQKVKDIFSDYENTEDKIVEAEFIKANLYKKSNRLEVCLTSNSQITIDEVSRFEDYIVNRFKVGSSRIDITYDGVELKPTIEQDWESLTTYMSKKEPMTRAILRNSTVKLDDSTICVALKIKGKDLLTKKKFDKGLERLIKNLYGKTYKVIFEEDDKQSQEEYEKYMKAQEHEAIVHMQEMAKREAEERKKEEEQKQAEEVERAYNESHTDENGDKVQTKLILGKTENFKSVSAKIADINDSTSKVNVEGQVTNVSTRDIKNNRTILSYSIDDGDSSIICKSFVDTPIIPKILERLKEGVGIKVDGKAQFDEIK